MNRYLHQITVPEIGTAGQQQLSAAKVLVIGAGGLGTPVAVYLAAAGVGTIGIADGDRIAVTNLHRQFLYTEKETGQLKATILAAKLQEQNPGVHITADTDMLNETNAVHIIRQYDIICDCTDNADARILIDKTCGQLKKPLVYAVVKDWEAYITVLHHTRKITLAAIFSLQALKENEALNCSVAGIVNTTCGIAASVQATETIKIIIGMPSNLDGGILCLDARLPLFKLLQLQTL
jgi:molybdopterin/thiamine biosynthesis adenylyltransferase